MAERPLTHKQQLFVEYYLGAAHGNATEAARLAGWTGTDKSLWTKGWQVLRNAEVRSRIQARVNEVALSTTAILAELSAVASAPTSHFMIQTQTELYDQDGRKVRDAQVRLDYAAKIKALELLMKYHRMLDDKPPAEVTTKVLIGVDINRI